MDISILIEWSIYLFSGTAVLGFLGIGVDIFSIVSEKKKIRFLSMLLNYINIVIEIVIRFLSIPLILLVISWVDTIIPAAAMNRPEGFFSFICKIVVIIIIIVVAIKLKFPQIGKSNEIERVNTRTGAILGALAGTGYFIYLNLFQIKGLFFTYMKMFGL